ATTEVWFFDGQTRTGTATLPAIGAQWALGGTGDFNGDGNTDIVWRNVNTGANAIWLMNGTNRTSTAGLPAVPSADWKIQAVEDFNNDNNLDVVFRNTATG